MNLTMNDFLDFKDSCEWALSIINHSDWQVDIQFVEGISDNNSKAECHTNLSGKIALIRLFGVWEYAPKPDKIDLEMLAFHEVAHIMTAEYSCYMEDYLSKFECERISESFANRMAKILYKIKLMEEE